MAFAKLDNNLSYWQKQVKPLFPDLAWNIPEQKTGQITVIGGNSQSFHSVIRLAEFLDHNFPLREVSIFLPDALRSQLPPLPNITFAPSTESGSFAKSFDLRSSVKTGDFTLLAGDLSKNFATAIAISDAITSLIANNQDDAPLKPLLLTRDSVDLLAESAAELLKHPRLFLVASMAQLQKVFRAVYYPRMIMLSQPLLPVVETLHKFTLSYPATIVTFHQNQIIVANSGDVTTTPIENTRYTPLSLWSGQLAGKIAALNLYNPNQPLKATTAAILFD